MNIVLTRIALMYYPSENNSNKDSKDSQDVVPSQSTPERPRYFDMFPTDMTELLLSGVTTPRHTLCFRRGFHIRDFLMQLKEFLNSDRGRTITNLDFSHNFYMDTNELNPRKNGFDILADMIAKNSTLRTLNIGNNIISTWSMQKFVDALANNGTLCELNLEMHLPTYNNLKENVNSIIVLAKGLSRNFSLEKLNLSYNYINKEGLIELTVAFETHRELLEIDFTNVTFDPSITQSEKDDCLFRIRVAAIHKKQLQIDMENVDIDDSLAPVLSSTASQERLHPVRTQDPEKPPRSNEATASQLVQFSSIAGSISSTKANKRKILVIEKSDDESSTHEDQEIRRKPII